jgi:hypothetical protein
MPLANQEARIADGVQVVQAVLQTPTLDKFLDILLKSPHVYWKYLSHILRLRHAIS